MEHTICIFGDSITYGASDTEGGWADRLKRDFAQVDPYNNVYNLGIPGDTTAKLLARMDTECAARKPTVIVVAIGTNDSRYTKTPDNHEVSLEQFSLNLASILTCAKKYTNSIFLVGLPPIDESKLMPMPWRPEKFMTEVRIAQYDSLIREFCSKEGLNYVELPQLFPEDWEDGLHPDDRGHEAIYKAVKQKLEETLV